jgi:hypothetical protein
MLWFLNEILRDSIIGCVKMVVVEEIPYAEIAKQEGLLRYLPLIRE